MSTVIAGFSYTRPPNAVHLRPIKRPAEIIKSKKKARVFDIFRNTSLSTNTDQPKLRAKAQSGEVIDKLNKAIKEENNHVSADNPFDYLSVAKRVDLWNMTGPELVEVYGYLKSMDTSTFSKELHKELFKFNFEVRDCLVRLAIKDFAQADDIILISRKHPELIRDLKRTTSSRNVFIPMEKLVEAAALNSMPDGRQKAKESTPRSLHVTIEYGKATAGGVGGVAQSLLLKMNEAKIDARIVTPFYDLYKEDEKFKGAKFVGFLDHELEGKIVRSTVYKVLGTGNVPQYMIKPDPSKANLFDIKEVRNVYSTINKGSSVCERQIYFASAVAAMGGTYTGRKHQKHFDIIHFHTWTTTFGAHVLKNKFIPLREQAKLPTVHTVQHFHHGSLADHTIRSAEIYKQLGLTDVPSTVTQASTQEDIWLHLDGLVFVSPVNAVNCIDQKKGEGLHEVAQHLHKNGRLTAVMNGIDWKAHSLASPSAHGTFAVKQTFDASGTDTTDYVEAKAKIKKALFAEGVIADPEKTLFLYVGRYSPEKGIDKLPVIVEEVVKSGGQCVIMGWGEGGHVPSEIQALQKMMDKHPTALKVYTTPKDQIDIFQSSGASKGNLIRGASEFLLMPSKFEGCALVVWEALARGSLVISSMGGGLRAQCFDLNDAGEDKFNAFGYDNEKDAEKNAAEAIQRSIAFYNEKQKTPQHWNKIIGRIFQESQNNDWLVSGGPVEQITTFYKKIMKPKSKEEVKDRKKLIEDYYVKFDPTAKPKNPSQKRASEVLRARLPAVAAVQTCTPLGCNPQVTAPTQTGTVKTSSALNPAAVTSTVAPSVISAEQVKIIANGNVEVVVPPNKVRNSKTSIPAQNKIETTKAFKAMHTPIQNKLETLLNKPTPATKTAEIKKKGFAFGFFNAISRIVTLIKKIFIIKS